MRDLRLKFSNLAGLDVISLEIILIIFIFSALRFFELPQWIDGYYHLSVANGFCASGGWSGWAWWDFAPMGRPHLYPPFYHLILVTLKKLSLSGLNAIRITEVLILPSFFFIIWYVLRNIVNERFSFFTLLMLSSFFPFYSSVSANVPASLALIFGLLTWFFIKREKFLSSTLFLTLSFYTHAGMPWMFLVSLLFLAVFNKEYRRLSLKIVLASLFLASPLLYHQIRNLSHLTILGEPQFIYFSIFIILTGCISLFLHLRRRDFTTLLFLGYVAGSILVFIKYPYRFFSAQGMLGLALFSSLLIEKVVPRIDYKKAKIVILSIAAFLLLSHATLNLDDGKLKFDPFNSTFYNFLTGRVYQFVNFRAFILSQFFPIAEVIEENTSFSDIISSNLDLTSQIFSALTGRPPSNSMFREVLPKLERSPYDYAKLIVWSKLSIEKYEIGPKRREWRELYDDDFATVYLNPYYEPTLKRIESRIKFKYIFFIFVLVAMGFIKDNIIYRK